MFFQSLKSVSAPLLGYNANLFTDHTLYKYNTASPSSTIPKRPVNPYILFAQEERPKIKKMYPSMKSHKVAKELGERYKSLSEHQKQPYVELSKKNFANYKEEMSELKKTEEGKLLLGKSHKEKIEKNMTLTKAKIATIKRTTNYPKKSVAYSLFLRDHFNNSDPNLKVSERFSQIGSVWKDLSEPNKQLYMNKAEAENKDLSQKIESWETANPNAVAEIKNLKKQLADLKEILHPNPKKAEAENIAFGLQDPSRPKEILESFMEKVNVSDIEKKLGYRFRDKSFLLQALTHCSYELNNITDSCERMEFLGDAILNFLITLHIMETKGDMTPGEATILKCALGNFIYLTILNYHICSINTSVAFPEPNQILKLKLDF